MKTRYTGGASASPIVEEVSDLSYSANGPVTPAEPMVRTQIYLSPRQQEFLQHEAQRNGETMAAMIRQFIDEKMLVPEDAWEKNSLLDPTPDDPTFDGHEDDSLNLDHYLYGAPKRYKKVRGKWVLAKQPAK